MQELRLSLQNETFEFAETPLLHEGVRVTDVFALKNNKSLRVTIGHPKYSKLASRVEARYAISLDVRLGDFLRNLKQNGDPFYREFLNQHGDDEYCRFKLADPGVKRLKGLYCFTVDERLKYIGKSTDSFAKRIDQGYGTIHPKNCFHDGQSTNCHLNGLIAQVAGQLRLFLHPMMDDRMIEFAEAQLIMKYDPEWNVQLRGYRKAGS